MRRFVSLWPAAASAVLMLLAFPPFNLGLVTLVGLAPFLGALMKANGKRSLSLGYTFGFIFMLIQMQWLQVLVSRWTDNYALALFTWILCGFLGAWYFALFGWLANRCFQRGWPWLVPIVWAGIEVFRSYIFGLAFPWGLAADPLYAYPQIIGIAYFGSIYLVSAWCALGSLLAAMWMEKWTWKSIRPYVYVFVLLLAASLVRFSMPIVGRKYTVTIGQPGVDMAFGNEFTREDQLARSVDLVISAAGEQHADLLVLPEGIADGSADDIPRTGFRLDPKIPTIFGGQRGLPPKAYQSAYSFDGKEWHHADKNRLVIFGEYVPFRNIFPWLKNFHLASGDLTPGERLDTLDVKGTKVGPLICFEGLFPDLAFRQAQQGSQLLAVISIDDWYMGTAAPEQLRSAAVWRAVETDLPLARAASLGYSLAVDQRGRIMNEAPLKQEVPLHAEFAIPDKAQPFPLFPLFPYASFASLFIAFAIPWLPKNKP